MRNQALNNKAEFVTKQQDGFALIMTVFVLALATILVVDFSQETMTYQRNTRAQTEKIQAEYLLKSTLNVAKLLLEIPKLQITDGETTRTVREDYLGEPWALVSSIPALPLPGSPRLAIVDESGKIDINSINGVTTSQSNQAANQAAQSQNAQGNISLADYWKNTLSELLSNRGFNRETYDEELNRTVGSVSYAAADQVAVIHDWVDTDSKSHSNAAFPGEGIESFSEKSWFYNRPLRTVPELAMVPGFTLERLQRIAPFVRVGRSGFSSAARVNVNTAPVEVLLAMGFPESQVVEITQNRVSEPITAQTLSAIVAGDTFLSRATTVSSREFSAYARVELNNTTRWAKALISVQGSSQNRRAVLNSLELQ